MKQVKFTADEGMIMSVIAKKGEFLWDQHSYPNLKKALKELMWKELINRKDQYINVFVPTDYGTMAIENNRLAEILNKS